MIELNKCYFGDNRDILESWKTEEPFIDCVVTSPPYLGLRSYLPEDHPDKHKELGLEQIPQEYVQNLVELFRKIKPVLKDSGTVFLNLGDCYAGSGKGQTKEGAVDTKQPKLRGMRVPKESSGITPKNLLGMPWRSALALQDDGWILRNDIIWHKTNAMPQSAPDRFTRDFEYIFFFVKKHDYYFDIESVREPYDTPLQRWGGNEIKPDNGSRWDDKTGQKSYRKRNLRPNPNGRVRRSVWSIPTKPYKSSHCAVYPEALLTYPILAGCPKDGVVFDPFLGSGTTASAALKLGRRWLGCELNQDYKTIQDQRLKEAKLGLMDNILTNLEDFDQNS